MLITLTQAQGLCYTTPTHKRVRSMKVLSLFDGMSAGRIALERAGIEVEEYYASEIDKYASTISKKNWPDIIPIGDVTQVSYKDGVLHTQFGSYQTDIDMVIGGSPCQSFSVAGNQEGFDGKSGLFYEWVRILREVSPKYFLLENVCMKKEWENEITREVGVAPILINSALVSAQSRKRLYWTNIEGITQPQDKGILLKDVLEVDIIKDVVKNTTRNIRHSRKLNDKGLCCSATMYKGAGNNGMTLVDRGYGLTCLTPIECERLQTLPDNYTEVMQEREYILQTNKQTNQQELVCCVNTMGVKAKQLQKNLETYALNITNASIDTEQQTLLTDNLIKTKSVDIVVEKLAKKVAEQEECVIDITKTGLDMELLCTQIRLELKKGLMGTKKELVVKLNTGLYMKIILEESLLEKMLFTTLILIKLIIDLKIYTFVTDKANIHFYIDSLKNWQGNLLRVELSSLTVENIRLCSNSQRYKMIGNGWTVDIISWIFSFIKGREQ